MTGLLNIVATQVGPTNPSLQAEMKGWETRLEGQSGVLRITDANRVAFCDLLSKENDADSYLTSPTYYGFTGRKGLWIYKEGDSYVPLCWHPNVAGQVLIFPVRGKEDQNVLKNLLEKIPEPPAGIHLARVKVGSEFSVQARHITGLCPREISLAPMIENILDWKYPVRILSTGKIADMNEHTFKRVRNRIRKAEGHNIQVEKLSSTNRQETEDFIRRWAYDHNPRQDAIAELVAPYKAMLGSLDEPNSRIDGAIYRIGEKVVAFTLWDISNTRTLTANRHANLCDASYLGLSDYVMRTTAQALHSQGVHHLNIGGSETRSLDDYKKKFLPASSIDLCSVRVVIDDAPALSRETRTARTHQLQKIAV